MSWPKKRKKSRYFATFPEEFGFGKSQLRMSCVSRREGSTASKVITPPHRLNRYTDPFQVELGWLTWKSERGKAGNDLQKKKIPIWQNTILKGMSVMFNSRTKVNSFWSCHKLERWKSSCKTPAKTGNPSTSAAKQRFQWPVCIFYKRINFDWSVWVIYMQKVEFFSYLIIRC